MLSKKILWKQPKTDVYYLLNPAETVVDLIDQLKLKSSCSQLKKLKILALFISI